MLYRLRQGLGDAAYDSCLAACATYYPLPGATPEAEAAGQGCVAACAIRQAAPAQQQAQALPAQQQPGLNVSLFQTPPLLSTQRYAYPTAAPTADWMPTTDWMPIVLGGGALLLLLTFLLKK